MNLDQIPIGRFSQITRLSKKALRLYDEKKILNPAIKDDLTGYRYYSIEQIELGLKIKFLSWIGFGLNEIKLILEAIKNDEEAGIDEMFSRKLKDIEIEIEKLTRLKDVLVGKTKIADLLIGVSEPSVKMISSLRVLSKREIGTYEITINKIINELRSQILNKKNQQEHVKIKGPPIYICHDKSYKEKNADIEVAFPISGRISVDEGFNVKNLPSEKVIYVICKGSYSNLDSGYMKIFNHATRNGLIVIGPSRQIYLTNPKVKSGTELITEIQLPIE